MMIIMPVVGVVALSPLVNRHNLIRWKRLRQWAVAVSAIFQPHTLGRLAAQVENGAKSAPYTQAKTRDYPKPTDVRVRNSHAAII